MILSRSEDGTQVGDVPGESGLLLHIALIDPIPGKIFDEHRGHSGRSGSDNTHRSDVAQDQGTRCTTEQRRQGGYQDVIQRKKGVQMPYSDGEVGAERRSLYQANIS